MAKEVANEEAAQQEPVWRKKDGEEVPISSLTEDEIRSAFYHSLKQIGYHAKEVEYHENALTLFLEKSEQLVDEAEARGMHKIRGKFQQRFGVALKDAKT